MGSRPSPRDRPLGAIARSPKIRGNTSDTVPSYLSATSLTIASRPLPSHADRRRRRCPSSRTEATPITDGRRRPRSSSSRRCLGLAEGLVPPQRAPAARAQAARREPRARAGCGARGGGRRPTGCIRRGSAKDHVRPCDLSIGLRPHQRLRDAVSASVRGTGQRFNAARYQPRQRPKVLGTAWPLAIIPPPMMVLPRRLCAGGAMDLRRGFPSSPGRDGRDACLAAEQPLCRRPSTLSQNDERRSAQ